MRFCVFLFHFWMNVSICGSICNRRDLRYSVTKPVSFAFHFARDTACISCTSCAMDNRGDNNADASEKKSTAATDRINTCSRPAIVRGCATETTKQPNCQCKGGHLFRLCFGWSLPRVNNVRPMRSDWARGFIKSDS
ncbi:hypothetical protein BKA59DRAFT_482687, partial [Fusarium tricinctum]